MQVRSIQYSVKVRFRKRTTGDGSATVWKVARDQGKGQCMQWLHCPKCTEAAVPWQTQLSAKSIVLNSNAQQLVQDNPSITAKRLADLLPSRTASSGGLCAQLPNPRTIRRALKPLKTPVIMVDPQEHSDYDYRLIQSFCDSLCADNPGSRCGNACSLQRPLSVQN